MKSQTLITDYYIIGDLHSAALVSKNASIDWLCLPRFDSPSIFAKLLDHKGGHFSVNVDGYKVNTHYVSETAIVESVFEKNDASFILHDFMVPQPTTEKTSHFLVRKCKGTKGTSHITFSFAPKADYARIKFLENRKLKTVIPKIPEKHQLDIAVVLVTEKETLILSIPRSATITHVDGSYTIHFSLEEGETKSLVLEYASKLNYETFKGREFEAETIAFWKKWVSKGTFIKKYRDQLVRSAITLKLMQFYETGALIAAPTTSLPEEIGGVRNWDYRYVWIRDATFTLYAFYVLGYTEEAEKFFSFIHAIVTQSKKEAFDISLFYTIYGKPVPTEQILQNLHGYEQSQPVRIGNSAAEQFQLDVYGALIDAHYFIARRNRQLHKMNKELILHLVDKIHALWQTKDNGIWEIRSGRHHFTYSKVMAWVGAERALRLARQLHLTEKEKRLCKTLSTDIHDWI